MSLKVGITGGIGAGKSLISAIFKTLGVPVYNADDRAKVLMMEDLQLMKAIRDVFGEEAYVNGKLDKSYIADKIFTDEKNLARMNDLVHPVVKKDYEKWLGHHRDQPYTLKEAALLFESGSYTDLDSVILVYAPPKLRLRRVLMRDMHRTAQDVERIMAQQLSDSSKRKMADHVIMNDDKNMVLPQVLKIHEEFISNK